MPLNGNVTLTSLKVRLGMFSLFPVYRLTSGLTVFWRFLQAKTVSYRPDCGATLRGFQYLTQWGSKFRRRGVVQRGFYKRIRHPQYLLSPK
jgi:hypothetical protein